jgi:hypothetical protein
MSDIHSVILGAVAQLGERLNGIQEVRGSIPLSSTRRKWKAWEAGSQAFLFLACGSSLCLEGCRLERRCSLFFDSPQWLAQPNGDFHGPADNAGALNLTQSPLPPCLSAQFHPGAHLFGRVDGGLGIVRGLVAGIQGMRGKGNHHRVGKVDALNAVLPSILAEADILLEIHIQRIFFVVNQF